MITVIIMFSNEKNDVDYSFLISKKANAIFRLSREKNDVIKMHYLKNL